MIGTNTNKHWEQWGSEDPYFGVISSDEFKRVNINEERKREFFQSGERHIEFCMNEIRQYVDADFNPKRCLDFGCGVGRVLIPMAKRFEYVVGVDISISMIREGMHNCQEQGIENIEFIQSDNGLLKIDGKYDFVHSYIVFQHIPERRGVKLIGQMLDVLSDNGVCALHFNYFRDASLMRNGLKWMEDNIPLVHNAMNLIRREPFKYPHMQGNCYSLNKVFRLLQKQGLGRVHVRLMESAHRGTLFLFCQKKEANAPLELVHKKV